MVNGAHVRRLLNAGRAEGERALHAGVHDGLCDLSVKLRADYLTVVQFLGLTSQLHLVKLVDHCLLIELLRTFLRFFSSAHDNVIEQVVV